MTSEAENHAIVGRLMELAECSNIIHLAKHFNITTNAIYSWRKSGNFNWNMIYKKCNNVHEFLYIIAGIRRTSEAQLSIEQSIMDEQETTIKALNGNIAQLVEYNGELIKKLEIEMKEKSDLHQEFQEYINAQASAHKRSDIDIKIREAATACNDEHLTAIALNKTLHGQLQLQEKQYNDLHRQYLAVRTELDETREAFAALACKPIQSSTETIRLSERLLAADRIIGSNESTINWLKELLAMVISGLNIRPTTNYHNTLTLAPAQLKNFVEQATITNESVRVSYPYPNLSFPINLQDFDKLFFLIYQKDKFMPPFLMALPTAPDYLEIIKKLKEEFPNNDLQNLEDTALAIFDAASENFRAELEFHKELMNTALPVLNKLKAVFITADQVKPDSEPEGSSFEEKSDEKTSEE